MIPINSLLTDPNTYFNNNYPDFLLELEEWKKNPSITGDKEKAYTLITEAFDKKLKILSLQHLDLSELPRVIGHLTELEELDLSVNKIKSVPREISGLKQLTKLDLSYNQLQVCPIEIAHLTTLKVLKINRNPIEVIPEEISFLTQLIKLQFYSNKIQVIPKNIGQLSNLRNLSLTGNYLKTLPKEMNQLVKLIKLHLSGNEFQYVPEEIMELTQLEKLNLTENNIEIISEKIGGLSRLTLLDLSSNLIKTIPKEISHLQQLQELNFCGNCLQALPIELGQLNQLESLDLSDNSDLDELPLNLGEAENLFILTVDNTKIPQELSTSILAQCIAKRNYLKSFIPRLKKWFSSASLILNENLANDVDDFSQNAINEWLRRLEKTKDYQKKQNNLALVICNIIITALTDQDFKKLFIDQIEANNSHCQDRSAMALNEIYTAWKIHTLPSDSTLQEQLTLLISASKTITLRHLLLQAINNEFEKNNHIENESVEIFLFYEIKLKEPLDLLTVMNHIHYKIMGSRSYLNEDSLIKEVNGNYLHHLILIPAFETLLEKQSSFQLQWKPIEEKFNGKLEEINETKETSAVKIRKEIFNLNANRRQAKLLLIKEWLEIVS